MKRKFSANFISREKSLTVKPKWKDQLRKPRKVEFIRVVIIYISVNTEKTTDIRLPHTDKYTQLERKHSLVGFKIKVLFFSSITWITWMCNIILRGLIKEMHRDNIYNLTLLFAGKSRVALKEKQRGGDRNSSPPPPPTWCNHGWEWMFRVFSHEKDNYENLFRFYVSRDLWVFVSLPRNFKPSFSLSFHRISGFIISWCTSVAVHRSRIWLLYSAGVSAEWAD